MVLQQVNSAYAMSVLTKGIRFFVPRCSGFTQPANYASIVKPIIFRKFWTKITQVDFEIAKPFSANPRYSIILVSIKGRICSRGKITYSL